MLCKAANTIAKIVIPPLFMQILEVIVAESQEQDSNGGQMKFLEQPL